MADLEHNSQITRFKRVSKKDFDRLTTSPFRPGRMSINTTMIIDETVLEELIKYHLVSYDNKYYVSVEDIKQYIVNCLLQGWEMVETEKRITLKRGNRLLLMNKYGMFVSQYTGILR